MKNYSVYENWETVFGIFFYASFSSEPSPGHVFMITGLRGTGETFFYLSLKIIYAGNWRPVLSQMNFYRGSICIFRNMCIQKNVVGIIACEAPYFFRSQIDDEI